MRFPQLLLRFSKQNRKQRWLTVADIILVIIVASAGLLIFLAIEAYLNRKPMLPGQQTWNQGVSSYLFGTNDTQEWSQQSIQTQPSIQIDLRHAGFTLMRSFFPDNASDSAIEQKLDISRNSGTACLGVITNIFNPTYDKHLVSYLGPHCLMYEFGNESDYNNISVQAYLQQWNSLIPALRRINPAAKFIGPVTYNDQGINGFMQAYLNGVKDSGVLPDAISFHWYPCSYDSKENCLAKAGSYAQAAQRVQDMVQNTLGKNLPIGISEWNFDANLPPPPYENDPAFITKFTDQALQAMAQAGISFACQFDAASYSGYGHLDMFQVDTGQPKPQFYAMKDLIQQYRP